ncbi:probable cytochrome P450 313a4 [Sabethes cyaneus]|uniref:probable cytochrome P450 313a4 n=1 Tax=Sabethes cyaneus TaxID=53552 RepID=UPI00237D4640|nr:probable cytochrome P450 313a4 [Sabethes cyaneus]
MAKALSHPATLFIMWFGPVPVVSTSDPNMIQKICTQPEFLHKPYMYDFFKLDYGLFSAKYHIWKNQRKALNPTFNKKILDSYIPDFDRCAQNLVRKLSVFADKEPVQMTFFMLRCTLEMVCATTLGVDVNQNPSVDKLIGLIMTLVHLCSRRIVRIHYHSEMVYRLFSKEYREDSRLRKEAYQIGNEVLQEAINRKTARQARESAAGGSAKDEDGYRKSHNFVDQLLEELDGSKLETIEILHNVYTIIVAGSDTSGTELGIISLMLAIHSEMQEKIYEEIMSVFPAGTDMDLNPETLRQLVYTEMFVKECLRHFPVAPHIFRTPMKDVELDGKHIPKGTMLCISMYNAHRRKDIWGPNADKFDPENFSAERSEGRHPFAFMPFSAGARNCLGYRYAMISLKVIVLHMVRNFKLKTHLRYEDVLFKFDCLLKLSNEPAINLERRTTIENNS